MTDTPHLGQPCSANLVGYGGDYPLWTASEEPDRHCWMLQSTTLPSGGSNPAKMPGSITWSDSSAWRLATHCKHDERNSIGRFFHIRPTLWTLPQRITTYSALSPTICMEFPSTKTLSSKIGSMTSSRPNWQISSSVGSKTYQNVRRPSWVMEENT
jgi:hypothetical protein